ncbi:SOS response-associated peptidase [Terrilactibacillus laevilacticus]|uniref:Abasic site processing protein n=1 Tax=Terrilactibacillus laevilacticus TaxID=1380157 RepID=A0ABW5PNE0_9BACI|nr:SOS response-associated peptidase [Terrilactibacillus laevilacticus]
MCGRYTLVTDLDILKERFLFSNDVLIEPRYNIAPGQNILTVVSDQTNRRRAGLLKWGLVPFWAKEPKIGYKMINARAESIDEKPSYKTLLSRRRCLILADSFYEWKATEEGKQPMRILLEDSTPFAMAGLWDKWQHNDQTLTTCTIITTAANTLMKEIHHRMPVILTKEAETIWLDRSIKDSQLLKSLLNPYKPDQMTYHPVSTQVNNVRLDDVSLISNINSL